MFLVVGLGQFGAFEGRVVARNVLAGLAGHDFEFRVFELRSSGRVVNRAVEAIAFQ